MKLVKGTYAPEKRPNMRGGEGTATVEAFIKEGTNGLPEKLRLYSRIYLPAGASIGYHVHEGEAEVFHFEAGKGRVKDDEQVLTVEPGDVLITTSGHGHSVENIGDAELILTAVIVKN